MTDKPNTSMHIGSSRLRWNNGITRDRAIRLALVIGLILPGWACSDDNPDKYQEEEPKPSSEIPREVAEAEQQPAPNDDTRRSIDSSSHVGREPGMGRDYRNNVPRAGPGYPGLRGPGEGYPGHRHYGKPPRNGLPKTTPPAGDSLPEDPQETHEKQ